MTKRCLSIFALLFFSSVLYAHPPKEITVSFDPATKIVKAVIAHPVKNPADHYIKKVDVKINGKEILTQKISRQDNAGTQAVSYLIPDAKPGDTISVEGYCNKGGILERSAKVE